MCSHLPPCPPADRPDRDAARTVALHPEQGWSLLCNGVIVFDDLGEILPGGRPDRLLGRHFYTPLRGGRFHPAYPLSGDARLAWSS
jgi:hypothetical protein